MTGNQLAMMSEWMTNENINQFVAAHRDANRFELVGSPFKFLISPVIVDYYATSVAWRCGERLDLYARSRNDSWRSQRGMSSITRAIPSLTGLVDQGQYPCRSGWSSLPSGLRSAQDRVRRHNQYILELIHTRWHVPMDESGAPRPGEVRPQRQPSDETLGLLRVWNGDTRSSERADAIFAISRLRCRREDS